MKNKSTDETDSRAYSVDEDRDVVAGGEAPRSRRGSLVGAAIAALLVAQPLWHAVAPHSPASRPDGAASATGRSVAAPHDSARAARESTPYHQSVMRPMAQGSVLAFLRWYAALPVAARPDPGTPAVSTVFRVRHSTGFTRGEDFGAVAQVLATRGWTDVARGDIRDARLDADGRRVAFIVVAASRSELGIRTIRTWALVASVADGLLTATSGVPPQAFLSGWFGDQVVIDRTAIGLPPVLIDGVGRGPHDLDTGISAVGDSVGDVQFVGSDLMRCLTGSRLGLAPRAGIESCPDDALVAASPDGRWAMTRDLRWLDRATGRSRLMTRRPPGWPVDSVDFVDDRRVRVVVRLPGRTLVALCSRQAGCTRPR